MKKDCPETTQNNNNRNNTNNNQNDTGKWAKPKDGEPKEKTIDGKLMYYCGKCKRGKGRWTNHKETEHVDGYMKNKRENGGQNDSPPAAAGNLAAVSQDMMCWDTWNE